jgi:hypothetical protein
MIFYLSNAIDQFQRKKSTRVYGTQHRDRDVSVNSTDDPITPLLSVSEHFERHAVEQLRENARDLEGVTKPGSTPSWGWPLDDATFFYWARASRQRPG